MGPGGGGLAPAGSLLHVDEKDLKLRSDPTYVQYYYGGPLLQPLISCALCCNEPANWSSPHSQPTRISTRACRPPSSLGTRAS